MNVQTPTRRRPQDALAQLAGSLLLVVALVGCGGGGGGGGGAAPPPAISVSLAPAGTTTIDQGQSVNFTATVTNDSSNKGVTWGVSGTGCSGAACGSFTNTTATTATYNAPTPVASDSTVSVKATSVADTSKSASSTVVVKPPPSITITSLSDGVGGTRYSATLQVSGGAGTLTWTVISGTLPPGLSLDSSTGVISGTPTSTGSWTFTVQVTDSGSPALWARQQLSITVNPGTFTITTTSLPDTTNGKPYSYTLGSAGGIPPITWEMISGALPGGLSLDASTGKISGQVGGVSGLTTASFTVQATDSATTPAIATQPLSILVHVGNDVCTPGSTAGTTPISNGTIRASISPYGDIDVYSFQGTAGAQVTIEIFAQRLDLDGDASTQDSYLDSILELLDSNCNQLTYNDDISPAVIVDSRIKNYTLPSDGTYFIRVRDFRGDGRPDLIYELSLSGAN